LGGEEEGDKEIEKIALLSPDTNKSKIIWGERECMEVREYLYSWICLIIILHGRGVDRNE